MANEKWQMVNPKQLKVALVCDWLTGAGGAERVVLELHRLYPKAPIYTSQYNADPRIWFGEQWFADADVRTGWLQRLPIRLKKFLPVWRGRYFRKLDLSEYDLVISASGAEAKGIRTGPQTVHISYIHAPTHYYWSRYDDYLKNPGFGWLDPLARLGLKLLVGPLRRRDYADAKRPDYLIANSHHTAKEIKKYYGRQASVIPPPVDVERFQQRTENQEQRTESRGSRTSFIAAGRQVPYKRLDLAVQAATQADMPLVVIGRGPDHRRLQKMAGRRVTFLTNVSDEQMPQLFGSAQAFIFPGVDDFGIVAVEAMAAGTPVIAYEAGGALDYVEPTTGAFFNEPTVDSLARALADFKPANYDPAKIAAAAKRFDGAHFRTAMLDFTNKSIK